MNVKSWLFGGFRQVPNSSSACERSALEVELLISNHLLDDGGFENATSEAGFEEKASYESRTGFGRGRVDFFTGGGRIGSGSTGKRRTADAELFTEPADHARRRGNRRRESGNILCVRQREHSSGS